MEWWYYGPIILAVVMFLLVGSICEQRIETTIRRILEHRRALLAQTQQIEHHDITCSTTNLTRPISHSASQKLLEEKSASQRALRPCKTDTCVTVKQTVLHQQIQTCHDFDYFK